jgi:FkbM family methyltransferase
VIGGGLLRRVLPIPLALAIRREWMARRLAAGRAYQERDVALLPRFIHSGDTCWDIGANAGMYTLPMSRLAARVVAFEPIPYNREILGRVVTLARLQNVALREEAVAERAGDARMSVPTLGFYAGYYMAALDNAGGIAVRTASIDGLIAAGLPEPSFIKCDVEGAEIRVLEGARALIARRHPIWLLETFDDTVLPLMKSLGYVAHVHVGEGRLQPVEARDDEYLNYLFAPDTLR